MTALLPSDKTVVSRLRISGAMGDPLVARLRVSNLLNSTDLRPASLPPSAIVLVRRLSAAAGARDLRRSGPLPHGGAWRQSVDRALDRVVRNALRAADGALHPNAEAVLFADRGELLACLAADWCEGGQQALRERWWWRLLLEGKGTTAAPPRTPQSMWLDAPQYIPAALARLSRAGALLSFTRALSRDEARDMSGRLVETFALGELRATLEALGTGGARRTETRFTGDSREGGNVDAVDTRSHAARPERAPPWQRYAPEVHVAEIDPDHQFLLGTGLTLARAPSAARAASFARAATEWARSRTGAANETRTPASESDLRRRDANPDAGAHRPRREQRTETEHRLIEGARRRERDDDVLLIRATSRDARRRDDEPPTDAARDAQATDDTRTESQRVHRPQASLKTERTPVESRTERHASATRTEATDVDASTASAAPVGRGDAEAVETSWLEWAARVDTKYGGLFYLVNLALFLNLYGDFTTPLRPGISLPVWDFLALVGRELCGEELEADPLWGLLARLSGRRGEGVQELGGDFEPPDEWRIPPQWLAPFAQNEGVWDWTEGDGRLRLRHAEGFPVLDVARLRTASAAGQLADETLAYRDEVNFSLRRVSAFDEARDGGRQSSPPLPDARLRRWLDWLMPYVRARLGRALGERVASDFARHLCASAARIHVREMHLDVVFELAELPFEIRLSGLDRDAGWIPAAGRFVAFHYV